MIIYRSLHEVERDQRNVLTAGTFDGVHRGHRFILDALKKLAQQHNGVATVVTFEPHPQIVLAKKDRPPIKILTPIEKKIELIQREGVDKLIVIPFTREFSELTSEEYARRILFDTIGLQGVVIGYDHGFGKGRKGGIHTLEQLAAKHHFWVEQLPPVKQNGEIISATAIRQKLMSGHIEEANHLLGYAYTVMGTVIHGDKRGKQIGFPTANIELSNIHQLLPANGVYAASGKVRGKTYAGMANIGHRPTFNGAHVTVEIHLFDFQEDIYGEPIEISFYKRIRHERKFESVEALIQQLHRDKEVSLDVLAKETIA